MKKILIIILILIVLAGGLYYFLSGDEKPKINVDTNPNDKSDLIVVSSPVKDAEVSSPLRVSGRARGTWYFEGSFPIELVDRYGNTISTGYVTSQGEWMTEDFVPFLGTLQFNNYIKGDEGKLILRKANPSDLRENDDSIEIPVKFK